VLGRVIAAPSIDSLKLTAMVPLIKFNLQCHIVKIDYNSHQINEKGMQND
tara:strand:+ start:1389 stop:1538 length:150 start_codon:yes stop_codon:yes gene_type:complete